MVFIFNICLHLGGHRSSLGGHHLNTIREDCTPHVSLITIKIEDKIVTSLILTAFSTGIPIRLGAMPMADFSKLLEQLKELHS